MDASTIFRDGLSVMVSDMVTIENSGKNAQWSDDLKYVNVEEFMKFLNKEVVDASFNEKNGLRIIFEDGTFFIPRSTSGFEYLHVKSASEGIFIFS